MFKNIKTLSTKKKNVFFNTILNAIPYSMRQQTKSCFKFFFLSTIFAIFFSKRQEVKKYFVSRIIFVY